MTFYGAESEVDLEKHGEREFSDYTWLPIEEMPSQVRSSMASLGNCSEQVVDQSAPRDGLSSCQPPLSY